MKRSQLTRLLGFNPESKSMSGTPMLFMKSYLEAKKSSLQIDERGPAQAALIRLQAAPLKLARTIDRILFLLRRVVGGLR